MPINSQPLQSLIDVSNTSLLHSAYLISFNGILYVAGRWFRVEGHKSKAAIKTVLPGMRLYYAYAVLNTQ